MKRTRHLYSWMAGSLALLVFLLPLQKRSALAQNPAAVELEDFDVSWDPDEELIVLEWSTATEFDSAGFQVRRITAVARPTSTSEDDLIIITDEEDEDYLFVPAVGDGASGATYTFVDYGTIEGESYWYFLVEVDFSGSPTVFDGIDGADFARQIWAANATPTPTPSSLATPTPQPSGTVPPAATATATPNDQASATPTGAASATPGSNTATPTTVATIASSDVTATAVIQPTATNTSGGFSGPTPTPFTFGNPGDDDDVEAIAQIDATPEAYPVPADEGDSPPYTGGEPPPANETATPYPLDAAPTAGGDAGVPAGTIGGTGYQPAAADTVGNGATTTSAALGDATGASGDSQSLLLWVGFIVALLVFAGGVFGSIILFTRRRAP